MRAVIQRVKKANVKIEGKIISQIDQGFLVLLAIHVEDKEESIRKLAEKIINLRIFNDREDKMNLSIEEMKGEMLIVSQFTLYGCSKKGNRPSFIDSARPDKAIPFYEKFVEYIRGRGIKVQTGKFGAKMEVELVNDGPVTLILDL